MPPFSSPQGNAPQTLAALWCLVALALVFVLLRLYTRYKVIDAIGVDDHLFNVAFVSNMMGGDRILVIRALTTFVYDRSYWSYTAF